MEENVPSNILEKRKYPRIRIGIPLKIFDTYSKEYKTEGYTLNISLGGMAFESEYEFKPGEHIFLSFILPTGSKISSIGEVVWGTKGSIIYNNVSGVFTYGIKFLRIGFFAKLSLKRFITRNL